MNPKDPQEPLDTVSMRSVKTVFRHSLMSHVSSLVFFIETCKQVTSWLLKEVIQREGFMPVWRASEQQRRTSRTGRGTRGG